MKLEERVKYLEVQLQSMVDQVNLLAEQRAKLLEEALKVSGAVQELKAMLAEEQKIGGS